MSKKQQVKAILNTFAVLGVGMALGVFFTFTSDLAEHQRGYAEGRTSVLNSTVNVGPPTSPCSVKIPLSVLAEMVSVGVMDWYAVCEKDTT